VQRLSERRIRRIGAPHTPAVPSFGRPTGPPALRSAVFENAATNPCSYNGSYGR
jgi:hypothetical protein